jgi:hypothetical protein
VQGSLINEPAFRARVQADNSPTALDSVLLTYPPSEQLSAAGSARRLLVFSVRMGLGLTRPQSATASTI